MSEDRIGLYERECETDQVFNVKLDDARLASVCSGVWSDIGLLPVPIH